VIVEAGGDQCEKNSNPLVGRFGYLEKLFQNANLFATIRVLERKSIQHVIKWQGTDYSPFYHVLPEQAADF
jgi:hypothetical protein